LAKIPSGILGPCSGKVGNVVGASWKGIRYIRQYVIPANPDTDAQKATRGLFADLVRLGQALLGGVIQVFWDPFLRDISGWAHFIGINRYLYTVEDDFSSVKIAQGNLEGTVLTAATYADDTVACAWDETVMGNGALTDKVVCFVYDEVNQVGFMGATATRDDEVQPVVVGAGRNAANLNAWLFFADSLTAPTKVSVSDHMQVTT
jgi:hypothetical protein